jgi:hypothetical protein
MSKDQFHLFEVEEDLVADEEIPYSNWKEVPDKSVQEVFDFWVELHRNSSRGRRPVLDDKRRRLIAKAIVSHGTEACLDAIRGCWVSPFHQGENSRGKKYDDLELILRDASKIENFCRIWDEKNTGGGFLD